MWRELKRERLDARPEARRAEQTIDCVGPSCQGYAILLEDSSDRSREKRPGDQLQGGGGWQWKRKGGINGAESEESETYLRRKSE